MQCPKSIKKIKLSYDEFIALIHKLGFKKVQSHKTGGSHFFYNRIDGKTLRSIPFNKEMGRKISYLLSELREQFIELTEKEFCEKIVKTKVLKKLTCKCIIEMTN